jgi:NADH pyrophosphatase NudC (nudix superfamily)
MSALSEALQRPAKALRSARTKPEPPAAPVKPEPKPEEDAELLAQRDRLLEKFTVMQADLGGAFYEMAIRDHVRIDALTRKAAELQRVDAELLAVERLLELERDDAAGTCPSCGAPFGRAARFCGQCGHTLATGEVGEAELGPGTKRESEGAKA